MNIKRAWPTIQQRNKREYIKETKKKTELKLQNRIKLITLDIFQEVVLATVNTESNNLTATAELASHQDLWRKYRLKMTLVMTVYQLQMIITNKEKMDREIQDEVQEEVIAKAQDVDQRSSVVQEDLT